MSNTTNSNSTDGSDYQTGSYKDNFEYSDPQPSADSNNFNNWYWEMYPQQSTPVDDWASFQFKVPADDTINQAALCSQVIVKATTPLPTDPIPYQDSEIFNNGCNVGSTGTADAGGMQPLCSTPFPNGRLVNVHPPYPLTDSCLDEGGLFLQNPYGIQIGGQIKNTPYYPSDDVPYCVKMRVKAAGQTYGTRGWGFWNTIMPSSPNVYFAWFWEFGVNWDLSDNLDNSQLPLVFPVAMTADGSNIKATILWVDYYCWHDYKIIWAADSVEYYIDGQLVATHDIAPPVGAAGGGMAYHCWVDNRLFNTASTQGYCPIALPVDKSNYMQSLEAYPLTSNTNSDKQPVETITVTEDSTSLHKVLAKLKVAYTEQLEKKKTKQ